MDNLDVSAFDPMDFMSKNSYFLLVVLFGIGFAFYQMASSNFNLDDLKKISQTNFIETINKTLGEFWLNKNMKDDTIIVDNNQKEGLLDRIVEKMDNFDV
jgi:hypothetical protein